MIDINAIVAVNKKLPNVGNIYRHALEIFQVQFQMTAVTGVKWIFGFPMNIKVLFTVTSIKYNDTMSNVHTLI